MTALYIQAALGTTPAPSLPDAHMVVFVPRDELERIAKQYRNVGENAIANAIRTALHDAPVAARIPVSAALAQKWGMV